MEYEIAHQEIDKIETQSGGLPILLGMMTGVFPSGDISLREIYLASIPCGGFRLLDIMQATESATEKYALGYIISRTGRYVIEHPEIFDPIINYVNTIF